MEHIAPMLFEGDLLVGFAGVPVVAYQLFESHDPDVLADDSQVHLRGSFANEHFLQFVGPGHFGNEFGRFAVGAIDFFLRLFHFFGDLTVNILFIDQVNGPNFLFLFHVVASERAAVEEDDLILGGKGGLAGMGAVAKADGKDSMRSGTVRDPPNISSDDKSNNRACGGCEEDSLAPGASFLDVALAFKDGNFDALRFGFGFAKGRADIAEEFHAFGANRLAADITFFDRKLAHVPETRLGRIGIGGLRRLDLSDRSRSFFVDAETGSRRGLRTRWGRGFGSDGYRAMANDSREGFRCGWRWRCSHWLWWRCNSGRRRRNCCGMLRAHRLES